MIEVKSKFDSSITTPVMKFQIRKSRWLFVAFPMFFVLVGLLAIFGENPEVGYGVFIIVFGVLFLPLVFMLSKFFQKILNKSMKIMTQETTNYFRFDDNKIYQEMNLGDDFKTTSESSYSMLYKAYETQSHFFMYISRMQTHVIPKKDIVVGTSDELAGIFAARLGKNFKKINIK